MDSLKTLVLAWVTFQPRTEAIAAALGGRAHFVARSRLWQPWFLLPLRYLVDAIETWFVLQRERPRVVVVISPPVFAPLVAWAWCHLYGARLVLDCHTSAFSPGRWGWTRPVHRWLASRVHAMTLHTEEATAEARRWTSRALLLPDDVPEPLAAPVPRPPVSLRYGHRVVIAGSLNNEEPVAATIDAARLLPDVEFVFTGERGRIAPELAAGAPPNVVFSGWLEYPRFLEALAGADVVASFSLVPHIMNRAAFEAIGLGRALVLTDFPGLRDRFGDAAVFAGNAPEAMAAGIRDALARRAELEARSTEVGARLRGAREAALEQLRQLVRAPLSRRRHRVLLVSEHNYPTHPLLYRNVEALVQAGAQVDLVCMGEPGGSEVRTPPGLRVHRVPLLHRRYSRLRYPFEYTSFFLRALPTVLWWSIRHRYDVAQVDNMPDFLAFSVVIARLRGVPVVLCLYELMPELTAVRLHVTRKHPVVRLAYLLERAAIAWSHHVIAVNDECRDTLLARGVPPEKVTVVPNTIEFPPALTGPTPRTQVVVTHATLVERYGVHVAIEAFARIHRSRPQLRMLVLGAGEESANLKALAARLGVAEQVEFTGFLPWYQAMSRIRECAVGVVPVLDDGYGQYMVPMKIYDYVTMGIPTVASRQPAVEDYFPEDSLRYVPPGDVDALAAALERLLDDPAEAERQVAAASSAMRALEWAVTRHTYFRVLGVEPPATSAGTGPALVGASGTRAAT